MIKGFITLRPNGLFLVSYLPPAIARVGKTDKLDAFVAVGDGFGQHKVPPTTIKRIWGREADSFEPLKPERALMSGKEDGVPIYLSRRSKHHGYQCMITEHEPIANDLDGEPDLWPQHGDGIYCNDFCEWFANAVWGFVPEPLEVRKVCFHGESRS